MTTDTIPAMPPTICPEWCTADHAADWAAQVDLFSRSHDMPLNDGTTYHLEPMTTDEIAAHWEPFHTRHLADESFAEGSYSIDLQVTPEHAPSLWVDVPEGTMWAHEVRALAAALLEAAQTLEGLS